MPLKSRLLAMALCTLLVAWEICPPAMRHAHEGGSDTGHRHAAAADPHQHSHSHQADLSPHSSRVDASTTIGECAVHLHWGLMGIGFSLPVSPTPHDPDRLFGFEPVMVRLVDDLPTINPGVQWRDVADLPASPKLLSGNRRLMPSPPRWINSIASLPLCDRARFERSGVLLA